MPVYVVSDLHGAADDLKKAIPEGSTLLLLGDLINFIDYTTMTGILTEVFAVEDVQAVMDLRAHNRIDEARAVMRRRSLGREDEVREAIAWRMREQYEDVFAALPDPTHIILGNADNPSLARECLERTPAAMDADGRVTTIEGERFGLVGGALPTPLHVAGEISEEDMRAKIESLGPVDVICSHIPPAVPELCFDTLAGNHERGSSDLLAYIDEYQPRRAYFGHVHQPLVSSMHIGSTLCVNVGYFRSTGRAFPHRRNGHDY